MHRYVVLGKKGIKIYNSHEDSQVRLLIEPQDVIGCKEYKDCKLIVERKKGGNIKIGCNSKTMMIGWINRINRYYVNCDQQSDHSISSDDLMSTNKNDNDYHKLSGIYHDVNIKETNDTRNSHYSPQKVEPNTFEDNEQFYNQQLSIYQDQTKSKGNSSNLQSQSGQSLNDLEKYNESITQNEFYKKKLKEQMKKKKGLFQCCMGHDDSF